MTAPVRQAAVTGTFVVASRLFGPLTIHPDSVLVMPDGMLGFAGERRFVLLPAAPEGVYWLQSVDDGALIFLLVDPFRFFPGYEVDSPDLPEPGPAGEVAVLSIVTLPRTRGEPCTANLQGPLVLHSPARTARQVILNDPRYHTRHQLDLRGQLQ